jgi:hypothetical protein
MTKPTPHAQAPLGTHSRRQAPLEAGAAVAGGAVGEAVAAAVAVAAGLRCISLWYLRRMTPATF